MDNAQVNGAQVVQYAFEIEIAAAPDRVWNALTEHLGQWWLPDFHMLGTDSIVTFEAVPGGRLYEQNGDHGLLWYTVIAVAPGNSLDLAGYCTAEWGGPCSTLLSLKLEKRGDTTVLRVSDGLFGRIGDTQADALSSGWRQIFTDGLKAYVERI